jgi:hypothetical protein
MLRIEVKLRKASSHQPSVPGAKKSGNAVKLLGRE